MGLNSDPVPAGRHFTNGATPQPEVAFLAVRGGAFGIDAGIADSIALIPDTDISRMFSFATEVVLFLFLFSLRQGLSM